MLLVLAGCSPNDDSLGPQAPGNGSPAPVATARSPLALAALDDALYRLIPHLAGPEAETLSSAIRGLATALESAQGPAIRRAADSARSVISQSEAAGRWHAAADLDAIRLAIAAADPIH
jgi:hypothetical protein